MSTISAVRKPSEPIRVYLAGKISKNDWRNKLVYQLKGIVPEEWWETVSLPMSHRGFEYVGPFFVSCDHGCAHGSNQHGAKESCFDGDGGGISHADVLGKGFSGVRACDLFIAWVGSDFKSAYGTITEIGMASALGKPIVIIREAGLADAAISDAWYPLGCSCLTLESKDPVTAIKALLRTVAGAVDVKAAIALISGSLRNLAQMHFTYVEPTKWQSEPEEIKPIIPQPSQVANETAQVWKN